MPPESDDIDMEKKINTTPVRQIPIKLEVDESTKDNLRQLAKEEQEKQEQEEKEGEDAG